MITCKGCGKSFNYGSQPEVSMGAVKCPQCGAVVDQCGAVVDQSGVDVVQFLFPDKSPLFQDEKVLQVEVKFTSTNNARDEFCGSCSYPVKPHWKYCQECDSLLFAVGRKLSPVT